MHTITNFRSLDIHIIYLVLNALMLRFMCKINTLNALFKIIEVTDIMS